MTAALTVIDSATSHDIVGNSVYRHLDLVIPAGAQTNDVIVVWGHIVGDGNNVSTHVMNGLTQYSDFAITEGGLQQLTARMFVQFGAIDGVLLSAGQTVVVQLDDTGPTDTTGIATLLLLRPDSGYEYDAGVGASILTSGFASLTGENSVGGTHTGTGAIALAMGTVNYAPNANSDVVRLMTGYGRHMTTTCSFADGSDIYNMAASPEAALSFNGTPQGDTTGWSGYVNSLDAGEVVASGSRNFTITGTQTSSPEKGAVLESLLNIPITATAHVNAYASPAYQRQPRKVRIQELPYFIHNNMIGSGIIDAGKGRDA